MTTFAELPTKKARAEFIKEKVLTDDRWMIKGLLTILANQTADEQSSHTVKHHNGIGFTGIDAPLLTDFANQLLRRGVRALLEDKTVSFDATKFLSPKQYAILKNKMKKYAGQLARVANDKHPIVKTPKVTH